MAAMTRASNVTYLQSNVGVGLTILYFCDTFPPPTPSVVPLRSSLIEIINLLTTRVFQLFSQSAPFNTIFE